MAVVLLTRPLERPPAFAQSLRDAGHGVHHAPVTRIAAIATPLPGIADVDGLLLTSAAGVDAMPQAITSLLLYKPCLATGPATAKALYDRGFTQVEEFSGEIDALLVQMKSKVEQGLRHWLYPCGTALSHKPDALMARSGAYITPFPVYSAEDCGPWPASIRNLLAEQAFDWTVFLSVRTAELFVRNIQAAGLWTGGAPGAAACISARVAAAIEPLGFESACIGEEKTTSSLVAAMGLTYC